MTDEERQYMLEEFGRSREHWTSAQIQIVFRYGDLKLKTGDREFELILLLSSLAVAFMAIVVPLTTGQSSTIAIFLFHLSIVYFFTCALVGVIHLLWLIYRDRKILSEDQDWQSSQFALFQTRASVIYDKLRAKQDVSEKEVTSYFSMNEDFRKATKDRQETRKNKLSTKFLELTHKLFFGLFFAGFVALFLFLYLF